VAIKQMPSTADHQSGLTRRIWRLILKGLVQARVEQRYLLLACPGNGLALGADVDNAMLRHLAAGGEIADLIWEVPDELVAEHGLVFQAAIRAYHAADSERAKQLWENVRAIWSQAWSANYAMLEFFQNTGLIRFSPVKPQQWVAAVLRAPLQPARRPAPLHPQHRDRRFDNQGKPPPITKAQVPHGSSAEGSSLPDHPVRMTQSGMRPEEYGCVLFALLGVDLVVIVALLAVVLTRRRWVSHQPGASERAVRIVQGEVPELGMKWKRGYDRWIRDILIWAETS
jgi:hypothetical protein